jgi:hypothetical protein
MPASAVAEPAVEEEPAPVLPAAAATGTEDAPPELIAPEVAEEAALEDDTLEVEEIDEPEVEEPDPLEAPEPHPVEEPAEEFDAAELVELADRRRKEMLMREAEEFYQTNPLPRRAKSLREAIEAEEIRTKGVELLEPTVGAATGAVRQFDLQGPPAIVAEIMRRYDLRQVTRYLSDPGPDSQSFLNETRTNEGVYRPQVGAGIFQILEIGPRGVQKLVSLEIEALRERGFDPRRDRLIAIYFGIAKTESGEYDLKVVKLQAEKLLD